MTPEERAKVERWRTMSASAANTAEYAQRGDVTPEEANSASLASIALSLAVIAEVVTLTIAEEAERG
jgi:hypothetical protein